MTRETFIGGLSVLNQAFRNMEFEPEFLWTMLSDLNDYDYMRAVISIANGTQQFYPGTNIVAIIRERALPNNDLLAGEAFGIMMSQVMCSNPKFEDPIITETVKAMGWREIGASDISQTSTLRAQFIKIYNSFSERRKAEEINKNVPALIKTIVKQIAEKK